MEKRRIYIIAEAGVNHNGSLDLAKKLIEAAVEAGADAVKFQTFKAERLVSRTAPKAEYQQNATGSSETQFEMIKKLELDEDAHRVLIAHCKAHGIEFLSTPFDLESVDLLAKTFDISCLKIPSGEITNGPLLLKAAGTGKKIILSTGMSDIEEIKEALGVLAFGYISPDGKPSVAAFKEAYSSKAGLEVLKEKVTLLHCTTEYPTPFEDVNLSAMETLRTEFGLSVGYSDHTVGITVPIAAAALGAAVIEKHFTTDRNLPGPDHKASLEPTELKEMVRSIRETEAALGSPVKRPAPSEIKNRNIARKSIVASRPIGRGEVFSLDNLAVKRPGSGVSPINFWEYLGKKADRDYGEDEVIG